MNQPLRRVATAIMGMMILLLANATYIQVVKADGYRSDPRNQRVLLEEYARERGQILAGNDALAYSHEVPGARLRFQRVYENGPMYAPVTGYYSVLYGAGGLEQTEDSVLNGSDNRLFVRRMSDLFTGRDPRGGNVLTTIVPQAQQVAYQAMVDRGFRGSVVAIRPQTGEILAMVSTPSYDPNDLASHDSPAQVEAWNQVTTGERPLTNRATRETYPPGSTFKLVVTAAALNSGQYDRDSQLTAASSITLPGTGVDLENYGGSHCGSGNQVSLAEALARSCNTAFAELAMDVGADRLRDQAELFGIGDTFEVPLPVVRSALGPLPDQPSVAQSGIGQRDVRLTPMQNAMIVSAIANGGELMEPNLIRQLQEPDFAELSGFKPRSVGRVMDRQVAETLRDMMIESERRTKGEQLGGVVVASKTGTAEHGDRPKETAPHGWYVAFAPADNPQIAIAVIVEEGGDRGQDATGASLAAPIGRAVIAATLGSG